METIFLMRFFFDGYFFVAGKAHIINRFFCSQERLQDIVSALSELPDNSNTSTYHMRLCCEHLGDEERLRAYDEEIERGKQLLTASQNLSELQRDS